MKRKVAFYCLTVERNGTYVDLHTVVNYLVDKKLSIIDEEKGIKATKTANNHVIQVTKVQGEYVYIRIGREHPSNTVALRNMNTLASDSVGMSKAQRLEVYTYCLLDLSVGIISYISMSGAPRASMVRDLFLLYDENGMKCTVALNQILTTDVLKYLSKKGIIGGIEYKVAVPPDVVLTEDIGLDEELFHECKNIKSTTISCNITVERNKSLFNKPDLLSKFISSIRFQKGDALKQMKVRAKAPNETMQEYDMLETSITKMVDIKKKDIDLLTEAKLMDLLKDTYEKYKEEVLQFVKI